MIDRYFKRRFKTLTGVRIAIFLKRPYDWIRLKWKGETILQQNYGISGNYHASPGSAEHYYTVMNLIMTQSMINSLSSDMATVIKSEINEETP